MAPQSRLTVAGHDVLLLGTVAGFVPDADRVRQAFDAFQPKQLALGVPPEDLAALAALATGPAPQDMAVLDESSEKLLELVGAFGATRIPSPDLEAAQALSVEHDVPLQALDLDDDAHAQVFTTHVKFHHVVQSNVIKGRLLKKGVVGSDAYAVANAWDAAWTRPKGLRRVEAQREEHMADRIRALAPQGSMLVILASARLPGVVAALARSP